MRIIHISSSVTNGSGKTARRINECLNHENNQSQLITTGRSLQKMHRNEYRIKVPTPRTLLSKANTIFQRSIVQNDKYLLTPLSVSKIDLSSSYILNADIVSIHSMYNCLNINDVIRLIDLGKKIVITLHDERFYTGGCHNSLNCKEFETNCLGCPQASFIGKHLVRRSHALELTQLSQISSKLTLVTPSTWMLNKIKLSSKLPDSIIHKISNPIPDVYFKSSRDKLSNFQWNRSQKFVLGFCAANINDKYKGLNFLLLTLQNILKDKNYQFELVLIGKGDLPQIELPIFVHKVLIDDDEQMSGILESLDLLIVPSVGDNAPNVIAEALATGTKVIGSNVGGIPEMLEFNSDLIFDVSTLNSLESCIKRNFSSYDRKIISDRFKKAYSYPVIHDLYSSIYQDLFK